MTTDRLLYPRLDDATAKELRDNLLGMGPMDAQATSALSHGRQHFAAVGGQRVEVSHLREVQRRVLREVGPLLAAAEQRELTQASRPAIDRTVGRVLHNALGIVRSDAAHDGVWSFLTLVLLPGVLMARFPDAPLHRSLGRPRNVLRRAWWRHRVLGELADPGSHPDFHGVEPLGEDEMVQLVERSTIASDPRLVRLLATRVLQHSGQDRSDFARRLAKRVLAELAHVETNVLSDEDLVLFIHALEQPIRPPAPASEDGSSATRREAQPAPGRVDNALVAVLATYRGAQVEGQFDPNSGRLHIDSAWWPGRRDHNSPSAAAVHVIEVLNPTRESPRTNGWRFWRVRSTNSFISSLR